VCTDDKSDLNRGGASLWWRSWGFSDGTVLGRHGAQEQNKETKKELETEGTGVELQYR
jgi:hypothetical protein